jgi:hypothetical protein
MNIVSILKQSHYVKYGSYLVISGLLITAFLFSAETPAGLCLNDKLCPNGSVSGYVSDRQGSPVKGVQVSILEDSAANGVSDANGFYTVTNVSGGLHTLCMTHQDYEADSMLIDLEDGTNDTLSPIKLLYSYNIFAGKVVCNGKPVPGTGITVAGHTVITTTDDMGKYVLDKAPKGISLKLIYAKSGFGFNTFRPSAVYSTDTVWVNDIELVYKGATVSGTVFDTNGLPAENVVVTAVGGSLVAKTDKNGNYTIENVPSDEPTICISAQEVDGVYGAITGINVKENSYTTSVDIYMRPVSDNRAEQGMAMPVKDVIIKDATTALFTEYPTLDIIPENKHESS